MCILTSLPRLTGFTRTYIFPFLAVTLIALSQFLAPPHALAANVVLWNKLGSQAEIEHSEIGLNGAFLGGGFAAGRFGNGYIAAYDEQGLVRFPKETVPWAAGTIEFWAKLNDYSGNIPLPGGSFPTFILIHDPTNGHHVGCYLNANDGAGNGGLCGCNSPYFCGTGYYGYWTYEEILGPGQVNAWHQSGTRMA